MTLPSASGILLALAVSVAAAGSYPLASPDGNVRATVTQGADGGFSYRVDYKGTPVILPSRLGLTLSDGTDLSQGFEPVRPDCIFQDATNLVWRPPFGERAVVTDHFRQAVFFLEKTSPKSHMLLVFRVYDAGVAFQYSVGETPPRQRPSVINEITEFAFTGDHRAWPVYTAQGEYKPETLSAVKKGAERPFTVETAEGPVVAIGEAALVDFPRMKFAPVTGKAHTLKADLDGPASLEKSGVSPWRYVMVADNACRLLEQNDLLLNLNEPSRIADTSWIKPGKVIRETSLTTAGGKACVDFAKKMNLQYVEFDAGWYGHEYDDASDARTVTLDPKRSKGPLDLQDVTRYAKENGVGVIVYVNRRELERRLDELLPLYKSWGIAGMKYGFVNVGSQKWTAWLHDAIRKAGEAGMMIDIHDEYRLTGNQRTWPNVMTVEGIRGNEEMPAAPHNCALPFTRSLCGPGDYTPCWYNARVKNTRAHQLALGVVIYSPWQFLFWYDNPGLYKADPELDFWRQMPTVWDDTRALHGKIGAYATIARRAGGTWFVGSVNALERRTLTIPLSFLTPGTAYTAYIYSDGAPDGSDRTRVTCATRRVTSADTLTADMADNGGHAVRLVPTP
jgi:alpha-glucosidase